jgi:AcrR family transcriptional regulator
VLLDAARQLMLEEGYAAVTSRRVAAKARLKPQLVYYYFRTMDDLFLALLRQNVDHYLEHQRQVLESPQVLQKLWEFHTTETRLVVELTALANHRPAVRAEIAANAERFRSMQAEVLSRVIEAHGIDAKACPPMALVVLITALSRILAMERDLGVTTGHAETLALVERYTAEFERSASTERVKVASHR